MDKALLHTVWGIADDLLRPGAAAADQDSGHSPVPENLRRLGQAGFFGLGIPAKYGGLAADEVTRHEYAEILASACGVTAFTQQQMQTGIKFVVEGVLGRIRQETLFFGGQFERSHCFHRQIKMQRIVA